MDEQLLSIFESELAMQCEHALLASQNLQTPGASEGVVATWFLVQGVLSAAANASKLLWGSSMTDEQAARRKPLRDRVGISDHSPLKPRKVRNAFEHFDERIESWFEAGDTSLYVTRTIGRAAADSMVADGVPAKPQHFGKYEPTTGIVIFWDHEVSVADLVEEMAGILLKLKSK